MSDFKGQAESPDNRYQVSRAVARVLSMARAAASGPGLSVRAARQGAARQFVRWTPLRDVIDQTKKLTGLQIPAGVIDKGYRGRNTENARRVFISGQNRGVRARPHVFDCLRLTYAVGKFETILLHSLK
jgi:hypothetical protein